MSDAIEDLAQTESEQEGEKPIGRGTTGELTQVSNDFYDRLLTIQHAVNLQWLESNSANRPIRAKFRIGKFPPKNGNGPKADPAPPAPPSA